MTGWKTVALGDVARLERDTVLPDAIKAGTTYVGLEHIETGGKIGKIGPVANGELRSNKFSFTRDHILYGKLRPYLAKVALPDFDGICSTEIVPIAPGPKVNRNYLAHFLRTPEQIELATARSTGANLPRLNPGELARFRIPLPSLAEQRRIAAILDQADALRAKRQKTIAKLRTLLDSIFYKTISHAKSNNSLKTLILNEVAQQGSHSFVNGPFGSDLLTSELCDQGIPVIYIRDIRNGEYARVSSAHVTPQKAKAIAFCSVKPFDVLVAKVGDPPGVAAIYPEGEPEGIVTQDVIRLRVEPRIADPTFITAYLNSSYGKAAVEKITIQATRARFPLGAFKNLQIDLPSLFDQRDYAGRAVVLNSILNKNREHLSQLDSLFASLQHRAFRGDL